MTKSILREMLEEAENNPDDGEKWYQTAKYAVDRYNVGIGERCIIEAAKLIPDDTRVMDLMGKTLNRRRQLEKAAEVYEKALEVDSQNPSLWAGLGVVKSHQSDFERSEKCYERALEIDPGYAWALSSYQGRLTATGRHEYELQLIERAVQVNPESALIWACHFEAMMERGRNIEAEKSFDKAVTFLKDAEPDDHRRAGGRLARSPRSEIVAKILREIIEEDPDNLNAVMALVGAFRFGGNEHITLLEGALERDPNNPLLRGGLAAALVAAGKGDRAIELMKVSQQDSPEDPILGAFDALLLSKAKKTVLSVEERKSAIENTRKLVRGYPKSVGFRITLANHLLSDFQYDEALSAIEDIRTMEFTDVEERYRFAFLLRRVGLLEDSYAQIQMGIEMEDNRLRGLSTLALMKSQVWDLSGVEETIQEIMSISNSPERWKSVLGRISWRRGESQKAIDLLEIASELNILDSKITLASILMKMDKERALILLQDVIESPESDEPELALRGRALLGLGRTDEARRWFRKQIEINPLASICWKLLLLDAKQTGGESKVRGIVKEMIKAMAADLSAILPPDTSKLSGEEELVDAITSSVSIGTTANELQQQILSNLILYLSSREIQDPKI